MVQAVLHYLIATQQKILAVLVERIATPQGDEILTMFAQPVRIDLYGKIGKCI